MSTTNSARRRLIIDTDGGVDDAAALWWALLEPSIDLIGVTTVAGAVSATAAADNVLRVLQAAGRRDVPVAVGADRRYGPAPALRPADFIHGSDGLGNTTANTSLDTRPAPIGAVELLHQLTTERPASVVSLGPLTNLALALARAPDWPQRVDELVVMGGSITRGGNALPAAEANIAHDPDAAALVVGAPWQRPPLLVGLDVTFEATFEARDFDLLAERRNAAAAFMDAPLRFYRTYGSTFTQPNCPIHDLLAVMTLGNPDVLTHAPTLPLAVSTTPGPAWGATIADLRAPFFERLGGSEQSRPMGFSRWRVALGADAARFRRLARALFGEAHVC